MPIPTPRVAVAKIGRAVQQRDSLAERDARSELAAAKIDDAISRALSASAVPLKPEHAEALAARLQAAAR